MTLNATDFMTRDQGRIYHLNCRPEDIADTILLVGDPGRVSKLSQHFDVITVKISNREFVTHTGQLGGVPLTVMSTGMGASNIDIVMNELDALVNVDWSTRTPRATRRSLRIIRLGTAGALDPDVALGELMLSDWALGLDQTVLFYRQSASQQALAKAFGAHLESKGVFTPYAAAADDKLLNIFNEISKIGLNLTLPGFYAAQGRQLGPVPPAADWLGHYTAFSHEGRRISHLEMETAAIYALAAGMGHRAVSISVLVAHRAHQTTLDEPEAAMATAISQVLAVLTAH